MDDLAELAGDGAAGADWWWGWGAGRRSWGVTLLGDLRLQGVRAGDGALSRSGDDGDRLRGDRCGGAAAGLPDYDVGGRRPGWLDLIETMPIYAVVLIVHAADFAGPDGGTVADGRCWRRWVSCSCGCSRHLAFLTNAAHRMGNRVCHFAVKVVTSPRTSLARCSGERRLRKNISPNKTWGGAMGALAMGMALPWRWGFRFRQRLTGGRRCWQG